jgi:recombination protein RecA
MGIIKKSGAWFTYDGEQLGQGRENAKAFLRENPETMAIIHARVYEQAGIGDSLPPVDVPLGQGVGDDDPILIDD